MAFGAYPEVSLADARKRRDEDRAQIAASKDPSQEKERVQVRQRAEAIALTLFGFFCIAQAYLIFKSTFFPRVIGGLLALEGALYLVNKNRY